MTLLDTYDISLINEEPVADPAEDVFVLPASFTQELLWLVDQLQPGLPTYNIPQALRLTGQLNITALEQSLAEIIRRHEVLRTTFETQDGQIVQVIAPASSHVLPVIDLSHLAEAEREAEAVRLALEEAHYPFDLAQGPLLRTKLLRLSPGEHVFLLTMHHIISDGWSMGVFKRELTLLYQTFASGRPSPLPELALQYADFAVWQREWLQGQVLEELLAYWRQQLQGSLPLLELPTDHPRPTVQTFAGAQQPVSLSKTMTGALKDLSQREGATLFMTLLAAFKILLYRYSGQADILVGTPIANRNRAELEPLIGFFVNTLVLRTNLTGDLTFRELLSQVRETALGAYAHQDLPFEKLVQDLQPERSLSWTPLFQVMFVLQNMPNSAIELSGLTLSPFKVETAIAKFDLTLALVEQAGELYGSFNYNTDLFEADTVARMVGHFETLLTGILADPDTPISKLPLLTPAEQQLLVAWNETQADFSQDTCIHHLFEAQALRTPDATAVIFENESITYKDLNAKSNQLAHYLRKYGVGPEVRIGLCVERSLEMVIGLLGILKAGGAYVPLDPVYPAERLAFMIQDAQMPILLTQSRLVAHLADYKARVICLDTDWQTIAQESRENPAHQGAAHHLAYIIYTSGSTGQPKGVMIEHRSLVNYTETAISAYALQPTDRILQFASINFDTSAEEIYPCLSRGATLVLRTDSMLASVATFLQKCWEWELTVLDLPTAYWHEVTRALSTEALVLPASLRLIIIGGERALPEQLKTWRHHVSEQVRLINTYGPTEGTIVATMADLSRPETAEVGLEVPIGRPIQNVQVYILDQALQPAPVGVPGELHLGGAGLARGYLNQPGLTAAKFIQPPPSPPVPSLTPPFKGGDGGGYSRLYKTGDLVRYRPDGNIEFLGRVDRQVKVRGFRIELDEIEAILNQHPAVRETVVMVREDGPGEKRLVAYVVPNDGSTVNSRAAVDSHVSGPGGKDQPATDNGLWTELRRFLKAKLPEYMIPAAFVVLEALPLTPNGKVDQRALSGLDQLRPDLTETFVAPRDELELQLAEIWEQILGTRPVGMTDNFFDLGGHSLLAVRLLAQIEQHIGQKLTLAALFQSPTIEELARLLRQGGWTPSPSPLVRLQPQGAKPPLFCLPGNLGNVFTDLKYLVRHLGPEQPVYGLQDGAENPARIEGLAAYYLQEIQAVQPKGPYFLAGICSGGVIAFEMAQQLQTQGQPVALLALVEPSSPPVPGLDSYFKLVTFTLGRAIQRFTNHWHNFSQLDSVEQQTYARLKAKVIANAWALNRYHPQPYPGRIHLFLTSNSLAKSPQDPRLAWRSWTGAGLVLHEIPGSHDTITGNNDTEINETHMQVLAEQLKACLAELNK